MHVWNVGSGGSFKGRVEEPASGGAIKANEERKGGSTALKKRIYHGYAGGGGVLENSFLKPLVRGGTGGMGKESTGRRGGGKYLGTGGIDGCRLNSMKNGI